MKIKSLLILVVLSTTLLFTSCLGSDEQIEFSTNDVITSFALPKIHKKQYFFTIDQIGGSIYNRDSLPFRADTIIDKIIIDQITYPGYITSADTLFSYTTDSVDLRKPLEITSHAPDGVNKRNYTIKVNVHQQDPDSLNWTKISTSFANAAFNKGEHKTIIFKGQLRAYNKEIAYSSSLEDGKEWVSESLSGIPSSLDIQSLMVHNDKIYGVTEEGKVYSSTDGIDFAEDTELNTKTVVSLIYSFNNELYGIVKEGEENRFAIFSSGEWIIYETIKPAFPLKNLSTIDYTTATGTQRVITTGKPHNEKDSTLTWFTTTGKNWFEMKPDSIEHTCPYMEKPTIVYQDKMFYMLGGKYKNIYSSREAITWRITKSKVFYPSDNAFLGRNNSSIVTDDKGFIWVTWGNEDEVWRGRVNKLGFKDSFE